MVSSSAYLRLWELAEFRQDRRDIGLDGATTYRIGRFGLYDYLFTTAPTVGAGLAAFRRSASLISTNHHYSGGPSPDFPAQHTTTLRLAEGHGRGAELTVQASFATHLARIRHATGRAITPTHIALRQHAPRTATAFVDTFGTHRIDFDSPVDSITFCGVDLESPLPSADPKLAQILRHYAALLRPPSLSEQTWPERVQEVLAAVIGEGDVSQDAVARHLAISTRTLQRRLAEADTSWRAELDRTRQELSRRAGATATTAAVARRLGYSDPRALRRAVRRWESTIPELRSAQQSSINFLGN
jgi:AraC-like DNA-binding protein